MPLLLLLLPSTCTSDTFLVLILGVIFVMGVELSPTPLTQANLAGSLELGECGVVFCLVPSKKVPNFVGKIVGQRLIGL